MENIHVVHTPLISNKEGVKRRSGEEGSEPILIRYLLAAACVKVYKNI